MSNKLGVIYFVVRAYAAFASALEITTRTQKAQTGMIFIVPGALLRIGGFLARDARPQNETLPKKLASLLWHPICATICSLSNPRRRR
ncbi:MAG: hypothetical protein R3A44_35875 [Caldilineaceae bacterium]